MLYSFFKKNARFIVFLLLLVFSIYSSYLIITTTKKYDNENHLVLLAGQFLKGHLALSPIVDLPRGDIADYFSNFYLYFGPFPSILLMPVVLIFGKNTPQWIVGVFSMIVSFILVYQIARKFKFSSIDCLWIALFFVFSTVLFAASVLNLAAYQVEALTVPLVLLSLREYFYKKRPLLIGLYLGLATLTRFTLVLAIVFYVFEFLQKRLTLKQIVHISLPIITACLIFGAYNMRRFHSFFETGYSYNNSLANYPLSANLKYGEISLQHLPASLYSFLIMPPEPRLKEGGGFVLNFPFLKVNPWGLAIWFTSPIFITLLYKFRRGKYSVSAIGASLSLAVPVFLYYSIGFAQYGYRYSLDFLPFLLLILIPSLTPRLSRSNLILICLGVLFNCVFITSLWEVYPHFGIYP